MRVTTCFAVVLVVCLAELFTYGNGMDLRKADQGDQYKRSTRVHVPIDRKAGGMRTHHLHKSTPAEDIPLEDHEEHLQNEKLANVGTVQLTGKTVQTLFGNAPLAALRREYRIAESEPVPVSKEFIVLLPNPETVVDKKIEEEQERAVRQALFNGYNKVQGFYTGYFPDFSTTHLLFAGLLDDLAPISDEIEGHHEDEVVVEEESFEEVIPDEIDHHGLPPLHDDHLPILPPPVHEDDFIAPGLNDAHGYLDDELDGEQGTLIDRK